MKIIYFIAQEIQMKKDFATWETEIKTIDKDEFLCHTEKKNENEVII